MTAGSVRHALMGVTASFAGLLLLGALLMPPLALSDERFHLDTVVAALEGGGHPDPGERFLQPGSEAMGRLFFEMERTPAGALPGGADSSTEDPPACEGRPLPACSRTPTYEDLDDAFEFTGPVNSATQHPPLYYGLTAAGTAFLTSVVPWPGGVGIDLFVWIQRMVSLAFLLPLPWLLYTIGRELGLDRRTSLVASTVPLLIPALTVRVGPMINNDGLIITLLAAGTLLTLRWAGGGRTWRNDVALGVVVGAALLTKGLALGLPLSVLVAAGARLRNGGRLGEVLRRVTLVAGTAFMAGGWWVVKNLVQLNTLQPKVPRLVPTGEPQTLANLGDWFGGFTVSVIRSAVGAWYVQSFSSSPVAWFLTCVLMGLLGVGAVTAARDRLATGWTWGILAVPPLLAVAGVVYQSIVLFLEGSGIRAAQGRYLYTGFALLAVLAGLAMVRIWGRWAMVSALVLVLLLQGGATWAGLQILWDEDSTSVVDGFRGMIAWSPLGAPLVTVTAVAALGGFVALAVATWRSATGLDDRVADEIRAPVSPT